MRVKPILFNTEMVRAILDGRKTATRRVIKPQPPNDISHIDFDSNVHCAIKWHNGDEYKQVRPPYQPGDILYVRET